MSILDVSEIFHLFLCTSKLQILENIQIMNLINNIYIINRFKLASHNICMILEPPFGEISSYATELLAMLMNIFTMLSRSRDSIKLTIENVIKVSSVCIQS